MVGRQRRQTELQAARDGGEEIVEVVRDAAGQPSDRLHLLRLDQLAFELLSIRDVRERHQDLREGAAHVTDGLRGDAEVEARSIDAGGRDFDLLDAGVSDLRQRGGRLVGRLPELEQRAAEEALPVRITPQSLQGDVGEGQGSVRIGDGDGLRAGAQHRVEDARALLGGPSVGDVLNGADRARRARRFPSQRDPKWVRERVRTHRRRPRRSGCGARCRTRRPLRDRAPAWPPPRPSATSSGWTCDTIFAMRRRLVRIPAVHLAQLQRPEDHVRRVVVVEDPDVADPDRLAQPLVVIGHAAHPSRSEPHHTRDGRRAEGEGEGGQGTDVREQRPGRSASGLRSAELSTNRGVAFACPLAPNLLRLARSRSPSPSSRVSSELQSRTAGMS